PRDPDRPAHRLARVRRRSRSGPDRVEGPQPGLRLDEAGGDRRDGDSRGGPRHRRGWGRPGAGGSDPRHARGLSAGARERRRPGALGIPGRRDPARRAASGRPRDESLVFGSQWSYKRYRSMRSLFTLLLLGLFAQDQGLRELIQRLEDDRAESREKAQKDIVALGEAAIPALKAVVDSVQSPGELKLRAAAVIREIELSVKAAKAFREPKRVTLKVDDRALREVLEEVARQAEVKIEAAGIDVTAQVTLDVADAPLFEVLDLICRDQAERTWEPQDDGSIRLLRDRHVGCPAAYSGPFRVRVQSINAQRNNDFKARTVVLTLSLQADWDRRYKPSKAVEIELGKLVDDQGS